MFIPYCSIHPSRLVFFQHDDNAAPYERKQTHTGKQVREQINGKISKGAAKNLRLAINTLVFISHRKKCFQKSTGKYFTFKINFITLTLPSTQTKSDSYITSKILGEFLRKWRKRTPRLLYIWKAEAQDNGNIHYHLTTNTYIHYRKLRDLWNAECAKHGIINKHVGLEANSTDVHSVKNIKNLAGYLVGYMSKKDLYTKTLKRYHRRFDKKLKASQERCCQLPKNYLKFIKRKITCNLWSASKPLLKSKVSEVINGTPAGQEVDTFLEGREPISIDDYHALFGLKGDELKKMPALHNIWREHINFRLKEYAENPNLIYQV